MLDLFSTKPGESGFRLDAYEIYNWGTFDGEVWKIEPKGETSLLTGANASGKTTLVDGLLTLLVPERRMRFYNQTAGAKGERTEESYVLGEYGETENEEMQTRETRKLRGDKQKTHSILLAVFRYQNHYVTLVQCRWFSGAELRKVFVLANAQLSITNDFSPFDSAGDWKKRLKQKYAKQGGKEIIHFFEGPREYAQQMRKMFGMRSEKSHTLFSQTVGLKVLGNLDEFVRTQMLEERNSEAEFQKIKDHFKTLSDAHKAIEKANEQIRILLPIEESAVTLSSLKKDLEFYTDCKSVLPLWFAHKEKQVINDYIADQKEKHESLIRQVKELKLVIEGLNQKERDLDVQIKNDEVGKQLSGLENEVKKLSKDKQEKEELLEDYNETAEKIRFQQNPDTQVFDQQKKHAATRKSELAEALEKDKDEEYRLRKAKEDSEKQFDNLSNDLQVLKSQKNNITGRVAQIRAEFLELTGASPEEIPFIGELMQIKQGAKKWESSIEKLLHNFALRLIVPEKYYKKVNDYVNDNDLKGRLIYQRYKKETYLSALHADEENSVFGKLDLKQTAYRDWLEHEIKIRFNYICTDDMGQFQLCERALTSQGLIKNSSKHEKDDRPEIRNRQQYVLGWDNKEKMDSIRRDMQELDSELKKLDQEHTVLKKQTKKRQEDHENCGKLLFFRDYKKLDWWSVSKMIQEIQNKINELQLANDKVKKLKEQREKILDEIKLQDKDLDALNRKAHTTEIDIEGKGKELIKAEEIILQYAGIDLSDKLDVFEKTWIKDLIIAIDNLGQTQGSIRKDINTKIDKLNDIIRETKSKLEGLMRGFKYLTDETLQKKFPDWRNDTFRLPENADFVDEYILFLKKVRDEELIEHKNQFKKYLNEEMITKMSDFKGWLDRQEDDILENVELLNTSLTKISFKANPPTFINIHAERDYAPKIKDLRTRLNDWKPNLAEYQRTQDDSILERSYNKIQALLEDLTNDEAGRKELLDVRNWLKFKAVEHHREDPKKIFRSYTGTAKLSGGEGMQLTYTILGSAIAYQFGIHNEDVTTRSFRFICVDEAFSKQDDEKARYLMDLCKQLNLQLMVVSPAKAEEVAIVEPYIAKVHFVQRKDNRNSLVYDMTIKQFRDGRSEYLDEKTNDA